MTIGIDLGLSTGRAPLPIVLSFAIISIMVRNESIDNEPIKEANRNTISQHTLVKEYFSKIVL